MGASARGLGRIVTEVGVAVTSAGVPGSTVPGGTVGYTITIANTGQTPYTGATVRITPFLRGDYIGAVRPTAGRAPAGATATSTPTTAVPAG